MFLHQWQAPVASGPEGALATIKEVGTAEAKVALVVATPLEEGAGTDPVPSLESFSVGEGRESNSTITYMGRVWGCLTRADIVGICDGKYWRGEPCHRFAVPSGRGELFTRKGGPVSFQDCVAACIRCMGTIRWCVPTFLGQRLFVRRGGTGRVEECRLHGLGELVCIDLCVG